jgi:hypothetical protein
MVVFLFFHVIKLRERQKNESYAERCVAGGFVGGFIQGRHSVAWQTHWVRGEIKLIWNALMNGLSKFYFSDVLSVSPDSSSIRYLCRTNIWLPSTTCQHSLKATDDRRYKTILTENSTHGRHGHESILSPATPQPIRSTNKINIEV